ncbi:MAG: hypothetical protein AB7G28_02855 [Pirellulales bacterium]
MLQFNRFGAALAVALLISASYVSSARAVSFTTSYTDGGSWNAVYAQGFKASMLAAPNPGLAPADMVSLDRFQFFKSGNANITASFRLAIVNNFFVNLDSFTTASPELVGLSTNTIAGTSQFATGEPITFDFNSLPLVYGDGEDSSDNNYAAIFVTEGAGGALTPQLVPVLIADYVENPVGSGTYVPESDYGDATTNYFLGTSNFISGTAGSGRYLATFNMYYADANFVASFNLADAGLTGDFNHDMKVDAADYTVWRDGLGGEFDEQDYTDWKNNFGATGSGALAAAAVPEPCTLGLLVGPFGFLLGQSRRRDR